jgi:hypothetical protein
MKAAFGLRADFLAAFFTAFLAAFLGAAFLAVFFTAFFAIAFSFFNRMRSKVKNLLIPNSHREIRYRSASTKWIFSYENTLTFCFVVFVLCVV